MKKFSYLFLVIGLINLAHSSSEEVNNNSFFEEVDSRGYVIAKKTSLDKDVQYFTEIPDNVSPYDYYAENWKEDIFPNEYFNKLLGNQIPAFKSDVKRDITEIERRKLQMFVFTSLRTQYEWLRAIIHYEPALIKDKNSVDKKYYSDKIIYRLLDNFVLCDCSLDSGDIINKANSMYMSLYGVGEIFPPFQPYPSTFNTWPFGHIDFISKLTKQNLIKFEEYLKNYNIQGVWQEYYCEYDMYQSLLKDYTKEDVDSAMYQELHRSPEEKMQRKYFFVKLVKDIINMVY